jgi:hypothetical protein
MALEGCAGHPVIVSKYAWPIFSSNVRLLVLPGTFGHHASSVLACYPTASIQVD